ncbi:alpha/beta hydrolase [Nocardioides sp. NPDC000445]|uniref:alpha/beta fold hydrolase n=1 Tax=Nocardioides sp. NPDC000445 TaxID=3154257 RepID=UPI0033337F92
MAEVVLIPGSFLAAKVWEPVQDALTAHGIQASAVELTGLGDRHNEEATLDAHVRDVVEAMEATQGPTLLVAHSYAGVPAALAVARLPQKAREKVSTILLGANLPVAGRSIFDDFGRGAAYLRKLSLKFDGLAIPVLTRTQLDGWGDHGLEGELLAQFKAVTSPHPIATYEDTADPSFTWAAFVTPPTFVDLRRDTLKVPSVALELMDIVSLDAGHWPMITAPGKLANLIIERSLVTDAAGMVADGRLVD